MNPTTKQPALADLMSRYMQEQVVAQSQGLGYPEPADQATPYDATPIQPVDPQLAWKDALAALEYLAPECRSQKFSIPAEWPALVNGQESATALAFSLGNYPQQVRNLHPLLTSEPVALRPSPAGPVLAPGLAAWADKLSDEPSLLLAAGVLRQARHHDQAERLLNRAGKGVLALNERAALAWHRGEAEKALALWEALPDSPVIQFNRGMARLFLGRYAEARQALEAALASLPGTSAWHHLAGLYLSLAERRRIEPPRRQDAKEESSQ